MSDVASRSHHVLPRELCDMIIDHLYDDWLSLRTCSIVCKTWVNASRYHLFSTLSVGPRSPGSIMDLASLLSTTPDVAVHIQHVVFHQLIPLTIPNLQTILHCTPHLCTLSLIGGFILPQSADESSPIPRLGRVQAVNITDCTMTMSTLLNFLGLFSTIISLHFNNTRRTLFDVELATRPSVPHAVKIYNLSAFAVPSPIVSRLVLESGMITTLKTVMLLGCIENWVEADGLGELLRAMRSSLRRLMVLPTLFVYPCYDPSDRSIWERLNLSQCTSLEFLDFSILDITPHDDIVILLATYMSVLTSVPASIHVLRIVLHVLPVLPPETESERVFWSEIDVKAMEGPPHVRIIIDVGGVRPQVSGEHIARFRKNLKEVLPSAMGLGKLTVVRSKPDQPTKPYSSSLDKVVDVFHRQI